MNRSSGHDDVIWCDDDENVFVEYVMICEGFLFSLLFNPSPEINIIISMIMIKIFWSSTIDVIIKSSLDVENISLSLFLSFSLILTPNTPLMMLLAGVSMTQPQENMKGIYWVHFSLLIDARSFFMNYLIIMPMMICAFSSSQLIHF